MNSKKFKNLAITIMVVLINALCLTAQSTDTTVSTMRGYKMYNNRNLHYADPEKMHLSTSFGSHIGFCAGECTYGVNIQSTEVFTPTKNFSWEVGGQSFIYYSPNWGAMADVAGVIGIRFGNAVSFGIDGIVGMTQMPSYAATTHPSGEYGVEHFYTHWRLAAGAQVDLNFKLSKKVSLGVFARYLHAFNNTDNVLYNEPEGWSTTPTEFYEDKVNIGLNLSYHIFNRTRKSGDSCWLAGTYAGYSFAANKGALVGFDMYHFKRTGFYGARTIGFGIEQVFSTETPSTNAIYGKIGHTILPKGAKSIILISFGGEVGVGEYGRKIEASADDFIYDYTHHTAMLAVCTKGVIGVTLHLSRFNIEINGKLGYHAGFSSEFDKMTGQTTSLNGFDASVTAGVHYSL